MPATNQSITDLREMISIRKAMNNAELALDNHGEPKEIYEKIEVLRQQVNLQIQRSAAPEWQEIKGQLDNLRGQALQAAAPPPPAQYDPAIQTKAISMDAVMADVNRRFHLDALMPSPGRLNQRDVRGRDQVEHEHEKNFQDRAKAYCDGAKLLLANIPATNLKHDKKVLNAVVDNLYRDFSKISGITSRQQGNAKFKEFLAGLIALVETQQTAINSNDVYKSLVEAERFGTWNVGRDTIVTLSESEFGNKSQTIVQIEIPRSRLTTAQAHEFMKILEQDNSKQPLWLTKLPSWQKNYLLNKVSPLKNATGADLVQGLNNILQTIPTTVRGIPGLANYSEHVLMIYEVGKLVNESHRSRSGIVTPIDLYKNVEERKRITRMNVAQIINSSLCERVQDHINTWQLQEPIRVPLLIQTLVSPGMSGAIKAKLDPANNDTDMYLDKKAAVQAIVEALKSPVENKEMLLNTYGLDVNQDGSINLLSADGKEYKVIPDIISTNHGINVARKLLDPSTAFHREANDPEGAKLLQRVGHFLEDTAFSAIKPSLAREAMMDVADRLTNISTVKNLPVEERLQFTKDLQTITALKELQAIPVGSLTAKQSQHTLMLLNAVNDYINMPSLTKGQNRHRQVFSASLEQMITEKCGGLGYGSCKSGKDRKGFEIMHTDAMEIYFSRYHELPCYDDTPQQRQNFTTVFADLYLSRHQEESAGLNAPGARGMKEIHNNLPKDLQEAIIKRFDQKDELKESNKYGSLNKIKDPRIRWYHKIIQIVEKMLKLVVKNIKLVSVASSEKLKDMIGGMLDTHVKVARHSSGAIVKQLQTDIPSHTVAPQPSVSPEASVVSSADSSVVSVASKSSPNNDLDYSPPSLRKH
jgi:hypothetical protein